MNRIEAIKKKIGQEIDKSRGFIFSGWGMKTQHSLPWESDKPFLDLNNEIKKSFTFSGDIGVTKETLDELLWRHYIITTCSRYALSSSKSASFVECGCADGLTAYFSLSEIKQKQSKAIFHLYDAWELGALDYSHISEQQTRQNLSKFDNAVYHKGFIPFSFDNKAPEEISYIHIDLNDEKATLKALEFFYPRLIKDGIIIFDDYGFLSYKKTKETIDCFLKEKKGVIFPLPTGQCIFYNKL